MKPRWTAILLTLATLVLAGCADDAEVGAPGTTTTTTTTPSSTTTTTADGPTQGIDDTAPPVTVETADDTVRAWVAALAEGDLEEAWGLTAEPSRVAIGGFEAFTDMRSALAEGFGAWAGTDNATFSIVPLEDRRGRSPLGSDFAGHHPSGGPCCAGG